MITSIIFAALLLGGAVYTALNPILLPETVMDIVVEFGNAVWGLEGIIPVSAIMNCLYIDFYVIVLVILFKVVMGAVAGKPEID